jgi:hypothetical protein
MMILGYEYIIGPIPLAGIELDRKAEGKILRAAILVGSDMAIVRVLCWT